MGNAMSEDESTLNQPSYTGVDIDQDFDEAEDFLAPTPPLDENTQTTGTRTDEELSDIEQNRRQHSKELLLRKRQQQYRAFKKQQEKKQQRKKYAAENDDMTQPSSTSGDDEESLYTMNRGSIQSVDGPPTLFDEDDATAMTDMAHIVYSATSRAESKSYSTYTRTYNNESQTINSQNSRILQLTSTDDGEGDRHERYEPYDPVKDQERRRQQQQRQQQLKQQMDYRVAFLDKTSAGNILIATTNPYAFPSENEIEAEWESIAKDFGTTQDEGEIKEGEEEEHGPELTNEEEGEDEVDEDELEDEDGDYEKGDNEGGDYEEGNYEGADYEGADYEEGDYEEGDYEEGDYEEEDDEGEQGDEEEAAEENASIKVDEHVANEAAVAEIIDAEEEYSRVASVNDEASLQEPIDAEAEFRAVKSVKDKDGDTVTLGDEIASKSIGSKHKDLADEKSTARGSTAASTPEKGENRQVSDEDDPNDDPSYSVTDAMKDAGDQIADPKDDPSVHANTEASSGVNDDPNQDRKEVPNENLNCASIEDPNNAPIDETENVQDDPDHGLDDNEEDDDYGEEEEEAGYDGDDARTEALLLSPRESISAFDSDDKNEGDDVDKPAKESELKIQTNFMEHQDHRLAVETAAAWNLQKPMDPEATYIATQTSAVNERRAAQDAELAVKRAVAAADATSVFSDNEAIEVPPITSGDFEGIDMQFVEKYENAFEVFLNQHPEFARVNPEMVTVMRVAKLQKILEVADNAEKKLAKQLETLKAEKEFMMKSYATKLREASKERAAREIYLQNEFKTVRKATRVMEGTMTWQTVSKCEGRARKELLLRDELSQKKLDDGMVRTSRTTGLDPLSFLPNTRAMQPLRSALWTPLSAAITEEQQRDLSQFQVDNAFLQVEANVLEGKLAHQESLAKKHSWVDSVLRKVNPDNRKKLKENYQNTLGVVF